MRHSKLNKKFGRNRSARLALVRDLAKATLAYESITTSKVKAKEARKLVERLISLGKAASLASRRLAYKELGDHDLVSLLFNDIAVRFKNKNGGYTRIYSLLSRRGDGAEQVILELTDKKKKEKTVKPKPEKKPAPAEAKEIKEEKVQAEQEKPKEEKSAPPLKEKPKHKETKPPTKFLGGLRKIFKKERDSL